MDTHRVLADRTTSTTAGGAIREALGSALAGRLLLTHPFYRRWEAGELVDGELAAYAVQYRSFEAALPGVLSSVVDRLRSDGKTEAADLVERNLTDELGTPELHLALFDRFAQSVAASGDVPIAGSSSQGEAAARLVDTYRELVEDGPVAALSGLAAYESQASEIAASKAKGLRRWYGIDGTGVAFWDVHAEMDADHGDWAVAALGQLDADPSEVEGAAGRAAEAWWSLLDERQDAYLALAAAK